MWSIGDVVGVDAITESIVDWLSEKSSPTQHGIAENGHQL